MFIYDITDPQSFRNLEYWYDEFTEQNQAKHLEDFPIIVVGNKHDIKDCRRVSFLFFKNIFGVDISKFFLGLGESSSRMVSAKGYSLH